MLKQINVLVVRQMAYDRTEASTLAIMVGFLHGRLVMFQMFWLDSCLRLCSCVYILIFSSEARYTSMYSMNSPSNKVGSEMGIEINLLEITMLYLCLEVLK